MVHRFHGERLNFHVVPRGGKIGRRLLHDAPSSRLLHLFSETFHPERRDRHEIEINYILLSAMVDRSCAKEN